MSVPILIEQKEAVAWITLNRPEALNAFNDEMGEAFLGALREAGNSSVRCVVITGAGRAFCAGEDLRSLADGYRAGTPPDHSDILRRRYNPAIEMIVSAPKPMVAAINGLAAGAGVSLALACDYRIMAEEASLVLAFSKVGLVPDSGATWFLPKYLGLGRAMEIALSGESVPASKAFDWGLASRVVPADELKGRTSDMAEELAAGPTFALGLIKQLIWESSGPSISRHLEEEARAQGAAGGSSDHLEGVNAFLEKRSPNFKGS